ncbi:MAG: mechanosensitive ion channel domain-containing protein [Rhizobiaceae bacterium]
MLSRPTLRRFALPLLLLLWLLAPAIAHAQSFGNAEGSLLDEQQRILTDLRTQIDEIEKRIEANAEDDTRLVEIRLSLEEVERKLFDSALAFRPRLAEINTRLDQIGPPPAAGQPTEPDIITLERQRLTSEKAEISALIGIAETQSIRTSRLIDRIAEIRRELFARLLTKHYVIDYALFAEGAQAFVKEASDWWWTVSSWGRFVVQYKLPSVLAAAFFALLAAAVLMIGGRRIFHPVLHPDPADTSPSYVARLSVAFWSTLLPSMALNVFLAATYLLFDYFQVLRGDIGAMMRSLFNVIGIVFFVHRLSSRMVAPQLPAWRLIPVHNRAARTLVRLVTLTAFFTGLDYLFSDIYSVMRSPLSLTVVEAFFSTIITGLLVICIGLVRPFMDADGRPRRWHWSVRFVLFLLGVGTILAALTGYIGMARFLSQQIVVTGAILAMMYLGFQSTRAISEEGAFRNTRLGKRMDRWFSLDDATHDQVSLVFGITTNILIVVVAVPLILLQWGFQPGDILTWVYRLASEIRIGSFSFSLGGVFTGIVVFVVGYFVTRWFQRWLDGSVMARGKVDVGVRNSIRVGIGYVGIGLAVLIGVSAAGIDLSNIALVAGALSLGIGFGLQNIVNNFVSGLILLAERPFKVGDWVVAGQTSGIVKRISVRATQIETFQRQVIILPNSELINAAVGNWTLRNKLGRTEIKVQVAYGHDGKRAYEIMQEIARAHPLVLKNPEPFVYFANFGTAGMEFEIRVFVADILNGTVVQNDIRFALLRAFNEEGIEIPGAPRHVDKTAALPDWPGDDDKAEAALIERQPAPRKPKRRASRPDPDNDEA